jgi:hypothetical protein
MRPFGAIGSRPLAPPVLAGNEQPDAAFRYAVGIPLLLVVGYALYKLFTVRTV